MVTQLFYLAVYIVEAFIAYMYFSDIFKAKIKSKYVFLLGILIYSIGYAVNYFCNNSIVINLIVFFIINLVLSKLLYDISLKNSLFQSAILLIFMFSSEMLVESISVSIFNNRFDEYRNNATFLIVCGALSKLIYLVICKFVAYLFSYRKLSSRDLKMLPALFVFPIMNTIVLILLAYTSIIYNFSRIINIFIIIISVLSVVFSCAIFLIYTSLQKQEDEIIRLQSETQKNEINKTFYELLEKKNEDQRVLVHDIKHHLSAVNAMENIEDVKQYLSGIQSEFDEYQYIGKSKNKMLDLILGKYSQICKMNSIDFSVDIRSSNLSFIEDNDLTSMLSNLLDNAVEAAKETDNAVIRFATKKEKNFVIISIMNSSSHIPKAQGEKLLTTKPDSSFHGYGTKSIEKTAKKYGGICHWEYNENDKTFHFNIIFNK